MKRDNFESITSLDLAAVVGGQNDAPTPVEPTPTPEAEREGFTTGGTIGGDKGTFTTGGRIGGEKEPFTTGGSF
jgi:hypothetical protein